MLKFQVRSANEITEEGYFMTAQQEGKDLAFFFYKRNEYLAKNELKIKVNRALRVGTSITFRLFYHKSDGDFNLVRSVQINNE